LFLFQFAELESFFGGAKPTKATLRRRHWTVVVLIVIRAGLRQFCASIFAPQLQATIKLAQKVVVIFLVVLYSYHFNKIMQDFLKFSGHGNQQKIWILLLKATL